MRVTTTVSGAQHEALDVAKVLSEALDRAGLTSYIAPQEMDLSDFLTCEARISSADVLILIQPGGA